MPTPVRPRGAYNTAAIGDASVCEMSLYLAEALQCRKRGNNAC